MLALAVFLDDLLGRAAHEIRVVEFGVDLLHLALLLGDLLGQTPLLGADVDDAFQRQRRDDAAHDHLGGATGRDRGEADVRETGETLDGLVPDAGAGLDCGGRLDQHQRDLGGGGHIHLIADGARLRHEIDDPADLGLGVRILKPREVRP